MRPSSGSSFPSRRRDEAHWCAPDESVVPKSFRHSTKKAGPSATVENNGLKRGFADDWTTPAPPVETARQIARSLVRMSVDSRVLCPANAALQPRRARILDRSKSLLSTSHCRVGAGAAAHSDTRRSDAGGSARLERRDSAVAKTVPQRLPSASAPFRLKGSLGLVAEPMLYRRSIHPSRRRIVRSAAEGPFFHGAKRSAEPPASLRRAPSGAACDLATLRTRRKAAGPPEGGHYERETLT